MTKKRNPDLEWQFDRLEDFDDWTATPKGPYAWNKYMSDYLTPTINMDSRETYLRCDCGINYEGKVFTTGVKSIDTFGDGKIEVRARFKGGNSSWPAIWLKAYNASDYYEIDLCEYFERRSHCKTGIFMPNHITSWWKRLFRPKKHPRIKKNDWNTFTCEWDENHILLQVNGKTVIDYKNDGNPKHFPQGIKDRQFTLLLTYQYGHKWCLPQCRAQLPLYMDIDYVKYWSK